MNPYELMIVFDPNLGEDKIDVILGKIEAKIKGAGGEVTKTDKWGTRRLASEMKNPFLLFLQAVNMRDIRGESHNLSLPKTHPR